ncbi:MAG: hypothetical protein AABY55_04245 [Candidatus Omnitrophota bacterium]
MKSEEVLPALFSEVFNNKKPIRFVLNGSSMYPVLRTGDILTVKPIDFNEAEIGDILAYQDISTKKILVHRMVRREKNSGYDIILTAAEAGQRLKYDQPLVPDKCLIARVVDIERGTDRIDLTRPHNILKAKIRVYALIYFHILVRLHRKIYALIDKLSRREIDRVL